VPPPPNKPPPPRPGAKAAAPKEPPPTLAQRLEKLSKSGYVDRNDAEIFIKDARSEKPDRAVLRELKGFLIKHQSVFDKSAFHKLKTFCETYKAENDVD
jgi:hypothetical protein